MTSRSNIKGDKDDQKEEEDEEDEEEEEEEGEKEEETASIRAKSNGDGTSEKLKKHRQQIDCLTNKWTHVSSVR